ncbi:MAG: VanZ family protein [Solobacterium sp.]|nr:VanZ family protein [Solobacterium sp.]
MTKDSVTKGLFWIYIMVLIWTILFKGQLPFQVIEHHRNINLIPFAGSIFVNGRIDMVEILANVFAFLPLGFFASYYFPEFKWYHYVLIFFVVSVTLELAQYALAVGISDITDVLFNCLGGIVGVLIFQFFNVKEERAQIVLIVLVLLFLVFVFAVILMIQTGIIETRYFWQ